MTSESSTAPGDAFAALGNEVRISILRTVADAVEEQGDGLRFKAIYDRVDVDSTSQFSYHLDRLEGAFLRKSDGEYVLTQAGERVVRAVRSGAYDERPSFEPTTIEGDCPSCGATTLSVAYRDSLLTVACASCESTVVTYDLPPAASEGRSTTALLHSCNRRAHHEYSTALQGTCSTCGGKTTVDVRESERHDGYTCLAACDQCGLRLFAPLEVRLFYHPAVVAFYWERGEDVSNVPLWRLPAYIGEWTTTGSGDGGLPCAVTVVCGGDELRTTVSEDLEVTVA